MNHYTIDDTIFEWDERKNASNIKKHGISFQEAIEIFRGHNLTTTDTRRDYKEIRELTLGRPFNEIIIAVIHTDRLGKIRIISARHASKKEREIYNKYEKENLGT